MSKPQSKMGRPPIDIDMDQLAALCRMKPTQEDCAAFFKCSPDTIANKIKDETGLTFSEFREQSLVHTRFDLIRKAIKKADHSDTMHIFCLKNLCGWSDKTEATTISDATIKIDKKDEGL
jgi:AraC-like DNA-binding protein